MPTKDKDTTIPFETQLGKEQKKETEFIITEGALDKKPKLYNNKRLEYEGKNVMPINLMSEAFHQKKEEDFKKAIDAEKDTDFWDKYVGVQLEEEKTTVDKNVPDGELPNDPDRFKGISKKEPNTIKDQKVEQLVSASAEQKEKIKDADAILFHIYARVHQEGRVLNKVEKQMVEDVKAEKIRIIANVFDKSEEGDVLVDIDGSVYENGKIIDKCNDTKDARANYPEAEMVSPVRRQ